MTQQPRSTREPANASPVRRLPAEPEPPRREKRVREEKPPREPSARPRIGLAALVFLGSLLGSLLGVAADIGEAADTIERVRSLFYPELCVVGSDTILGEQLGVSAELETGFEQRTNNDANPDNVNVTTEAIGSVNGVRRAAEGGCVHVLAMSEPIPQENQDELAAAGLTLTCAAEVGFDVIAFATDINNPVATLQRRDLGGVLRGDIRNWSQISRTYDQPIVIYYRPGSGTTDYVFRNIINHTDPNNPPVGAHYEPCGSNEECLDLTLSTPGGLYWVSSAWMRTQPPEYLRVLPILTGDEAPVNPLTDSIDLSSYPQFLIRPLFMYTLGGANINENTQALARQYLEYVRSVRGQEALQTHAFQTHFDRPTNLAIPLPAGFSIVPGERRQLCGTAPNAATS